MRSNPTQNIQDNSRYTEAELLSVAGAKDRLPKTLASYASLKGNDQVAAIQEMTGDVVTLTLADAVDGETWLGQMAEVTRIHQPTLRKTIQERVRGYQELSNHKTEKRSHQPGRNGTALLKSGADGAIADFLSEYNDSRADDFIILPGGGVTITQTAENLFQRIESKGGLFMRGGAVTRTAKDAQGSLTLEVIKPAMARSFFEGFGKMMSWRQGADNKP